MNIKVKKMLGAAKLPIFLVLWSLSLIAVVANVRTADAAMMNVSASTWSERTLPSFEESLADKLELAIKQSDLTTGAWQPRQKFVATPHVQVVVETNQPLVAAVVADAVVSPVSEITEPEIVKKPVVKRSLEKTVKAKRIARQYMDSGQHGLAYELLRGGLAIAVEDTEYLGLTAVAAIRSGRMIDASILYERLTELQPQEARWWAGLGVCQEAMGLVAYYSFQMAETVADAGSVLDQYASLRTSATT